MPSWVSAMPQIRTAKAAVPARLITSSLVAEVGRSFQGFHQAANADPVSKPMRCVSVPRYTRLGSPPSICVTYSQAIQTVLATAMKPAIQPSPCLPVLFKSHNANSGQAR